MNSRPLIAVSDNEMDENLLTLTPNHLKSGKALAILPSSFDELSLDKLQKIKIVTRWHERKRIQREFFVRFSEEYLDNLKKITKNHEKRKLKR